MLKPLSSAPMLMTWPKQQEVRTMSAGDADGPVVAMHIGSTHARVGVMRRGRVEVVADNRGMRLIPACIAFTEKGRLVGHDAIEQKSGNRNNTITGPMRLMGLKQNELRTALKDTPLKIEGEKYKPTIEVREKGKYVKYSVPQLTSFLMDYLKDMAHKFLGQEVTKAVFVIPVSFTDNQKQAVELAAKFSNIEIVDMIEEPVAALMAYKLNQKSGHHLVFHCGGERTVVTILENGKVLQSSASGLAFGGNEFDQRLQVHCLETIQQESGKYIAANDESFFRLMEKSEKAKIRLSSAPQVDVIHENNSAIPVCQAEFNDWCKDLFSVINRHIDKVMEEKGLSLNQIQKVIMTGGSCQMPSLKQLIVQKFGHEKLVSLKNIFTDETVVYGAAIRSASFAPQNQALVPIIQTTTRKLPFKEQHRISAKKAKLDPKQILVAGDSGVGPVIGIDLGTTNSCVGIWKRNKNGNEGIVEIIPDENGKKTIPSVVAFKSDPVSGTTRLIGEEAKEYACIEPQNVVFESKRLIGRKYDDPVVQHDMKIWPFVVKDKDSKPVIQIELNGKTEQFHAEEIAAAILSKLKSMAESYTGKKITKAVITVPAYFNNFQRTATKEAAKIAGLEVLKIINEPTAAAIAYGLDFLRGNERNILVYDLGGGTFDVSIISVKDKKFKVRATAGDTHLGGADFDNRLVSYFKNRFQRKYGSDLSSDKRSMARLRFACEKAKIRLSDCESGSTDLQVDGLDGIDYSDTINKNTFETLCEGLFKKTIDLMSRVLKDARIKRRDIDDIVMVGGSTRIPEIRELVSEFFGGRDLQFRINPDEAVAYGAVMQSAMLSGDLALLSVRDVTPLSLGTEVIGGLMSVIIPRNTPIPVERTEKFCTIEDNETSTVVRVYQGERPMLKDNVKLGEFEVTGIPAAPRGVSGYPITMKLDEDGILEVKVQPRPGALFQSLRITNPCNLPESEVERMIGTAAEMRANDQKALERANARNDLYFVCYDYRHDARIGRRCQEMLQWLKDNPDAEKEVLMRKMREIHY